MVFTFINMPKCSLRTTKTSQKHTTRGRSHSRSDPDCYTGQWVIWVSNSNPVSMLTHTQTNIYLIKFSNYEFEIETIAVPAPVIVSLSKII